VGNVPAQRDDPGILFSVVTPSLNQARYLPRNLDSVLEQSIGRVEHIVVDGGSVDGSVAILDDYVERHPGRVCYVSEVDAGQCEALNKGIRMARGRFVGWQNVDDYYLPDAFSTALEYLDRHPQEVGVYGECQKIDGTGRVIGRWPTGPFDLSRLLMQDYVPNQSAFIRRDVLFELLIDESMEYAMDYDLWLRLALNHSLGYIPVVLAVNRILPDAKSQVGMFPLLCDRVRAVQRTLAEPGIAEALPEGRRALLRHILKALLVALLLGRGRDARRLGLRAIGLRCQGGEWMWALFTLGAKSPWPRDVPGDATFAFRATRMLEAARLTGDQRPGKSDGMAESIGRLTRTVIWRCLHVWTHFRRPRVCS